MNDQLYRTQVALLIRIIPLVYKIEDFAVHGGTAINLFHQNMLRYSVDIDLTYIHRITRGESDKNKPTSSNDENSYRTGYSWDKSIAQTRGVETAMYL